MKLTYDPRHNVAYLRLHEKPGKKCGKESAV